MDFNIGKVTVYMWTRDSVEPVGHCSIFIEHSDEETYISFFPEEEIRLEDTVANVASIMPESYEEDRTEDWCGCEADDKITFYVPYDGSRVCLDWLKSKYESKSYNLVNNNCVTVVRDSLWDVMGKSVSAISPRGVLQEVSKLRASIVFPSIACKECGDDMYFCEGCEGYVCDHWH